MNQLLQNGATLTDTNQQVYEYFLDQNSWIHTSAEYNDDLVTLMSDGLISPTIMEKLEQIKQYNSDGRLIGPKLISSPNAYWYLLNSPHTLNVNVNGDVIDIDIDTNKIIKQLHRTTYCHGQKGKTGAVGSQGEDGTPAPSEEYLIPIIKEQVMIIETEVLTPLDTPISTRIYYEFQLKAEIRYDLNNVVSFNYYNQSEILDEDKTTVIFTNGVLKAELYKKDGKNWEKNWKYKARQVGPTGSPGIDGNKFLQAIDNNVADTSIRNDRSVRIIRKNGRDDIIYIIAAMGEVTPVAHLRINNDVSFIQIPQTLRNEEANEYWAAVEPTADAKNICRWRLLSDNIKADDLTLPEWTPLKVNGYGGWTGTELVNDVPCCQENLFICATVIQSCK